MQAQQEIWEVDEQRAALWQSDPHRAAMLAYLDVVALWHEQVEQGMYWGIPALHRLPTDSYPVAERSTQRSRPARYTRDDSAGQWLVPGEVRERWLAAA